MKTDHHNGEATGFEVASLGHIRRDLATLAAAAAAVVWHSHLLIPMTFSAELDCSDLLALICQPRAPWHFLTKFS